MSGYQHRQYGQEAAIGAGAGVRPARLRRRIAALTAALVLMASAAGRAQQGQTGQLSGIVTDASGAGVQQASVRVSSPQLIGGAQQTETDGEGRYRFVRLPPGSYTVQVERAGFGLVSREGVELRPGLLTTLDLRIEIAPLTEAMRVQGGGSLVDVRSSASPALLSRQLLNLLPQPLNRDVVQYADLAPGVTAGVALGGPFLNIQLSLDGTRGNDPMYGAPVATPAVSWIESLQLVSLGAGAEYGEYTSAQLNAVTRSGANTLSGEAEVWGAPQQFSDANRDSLPPELRDAFRGSDLLEWWGLSGQAGGPVRRDRLWFFAGLDYTRLRYRLPSFSGPRRADEPAYDSHDPQWIAKFTGAPADDSRLEAYVIQERPEDRNGNAGPFVTPEAYSLSTTRFQMGNARYLQRIGDRTLFSAEYHGLWSDALRGPASPEGRKGPSPRFDQATLVTSVNVSSFSEVSRDLHGASARLTRFVDRFAGGSHDFEIGVEHERTRREATFAYPGGALHLDRNGAPEFVRLWAGQTTRPRHHRTSAFVQDAWRVGSDVTVNAGLRFSQYGSALPDVSAPLYDTWFVSPRAGLAWDAGADHRTVVRLHYGHYHDPMATGFYEAFDPLAQAPTITLRVLESGRLEEIARTGGAADPARIDPAVKHSYAEEILAGLEHELLPLVSVKAQYVRRNTRKAVGYIDVGSRWAPVAVVDPGRDGRLGTPDDGAQLTVFSRVAGSSPDYVLTNPDGAWRHYDAVQLIASRRGDRWTLDGSYTWSWTRGSFDNDHASNGGSSDMSPFGQFANPNRAILATGRTLYDRRHDLEVFGTAEIPVWGGLRAGGIYRFTSGTPYGRLVNAWGPLTSFAQVIVEPTGRYELPATHNLDLRIEKTMRVRATTLGLYADVFNATNRGVATRVNNISGPSFGLPRSWLGPRQVRGGFRVTW